MAELEGVMRYPEKFLTDDETIIAELHPHWRTLLPVGLWTVLGIGGLWLAIVNLEDTALWIVVALIVLGWSVLSLPGQSVLKNVPNPEAFQSMVYRSREDRVMQLEGSGPGRDVAAQLRDLAALRDAGDLSATQFEEEKRRLLGS